MIRSLTALASPAGKNARLTSFIFHRVLSAPSELFPSEPDAETFSLLLTWITGQFRVLDPVEACDRLERGALPARAAVVTFDDGYRDNHDIAWPILNRFGIPAAFFVATGFLDGGAMFNDRIIAAVAGSRREVLDLPDELGRALSVRTVEEKRAVIDRVISKVKPMEPGLRSDFVNRVVEAAGADAPADLMMTSAQVAALARGGMIIGGHTRNHPILRALDDRVARDEIEGGLADLANITGCRPTLFAYPNGRPGVDFDHKHCEMARACGVRHAFTTARGTSCRLTDPMRLSRFTPWDRRAGRFRVRALLNVVGSRFGPGSDLRMGVAARRTGMEVR